MTSVSHQKADRRAEHLGNSKVSKIQPIFSRLQLVNFENFQLIWSVPTFVHSIAQSLWMVYDS